MYIRTVSTYVHVVSLMSHVGLRAPCRSEDVKTERDTPSLPPCLPVCLSVCLSRSLPRSNSPARSNSLARSLVLALDVAWPVCGRACAHCLGDCVLDRRQTDVDRRRRGSWWFPGGVVVFVGIRRCACCLVGKGGAACCECRWTIVVHGVQRKSPVGWSGGRGDARVPAVEPSPSGERGSVPIVRDGEPAILTAGRQRLRGPTECF